MRSTFRLYTLLVLWGCASQEDPPKKAPAAPPLAPPKAELVPHTTVLHGEELQDPYFWLRKREDPKTIAYLEAENRFAEAKMEHTKPLQKKLYDEMLARIKEDDTSVPYKHGGYWYYTRTESKKPYKIYARKKGELLAPEEILLDGNAMAEGKPYFQIGVFEPSPDHGLLAFSVDESGSERFVLQFKDLKTGKVLDDKITDTYYTLAWASDNKTVFYTTLDPATRPFKLMRHKLGSAAGTDVLIHHETDERFFVEVSRSRSDRFVLLKTESAVTTEVQFLDAAQPEGKFQPIRARQANVEYSVDHANDQFFVRTNEQAMNFKIMTAPLKEPSKAKWKELIPHREEVTLAWIGAFKNHLVIQEREGGLPHLRFRSLKPGKKVDDHRMGVEEPAYALWPEPTPEFDPLAFRFGFISLLTPESTFEYGLDKRQKVLLKQEEVIGYDRTRYRSFRFAAKAPDGSQIPVSLVKSASTAQDGSAPLLLNGYGAYGYAYDPGFHSSWLSLLDRGFSVAIAHVRGGGEMGRRWKEDGKLKKKVNTFIDFIAVAELLVADKHTSADRMAISGRSAGGLLIGAVTNMRPDLFRVVIAGVPFVDVVNTMLDASIPLTAIEWEEWGNPNVKEDYETIKAYSPYDNVRAQAYPAMLVLAGLNDPRVGYWEPAKWTAKLRAQRTDQQLLLLKTNMGAGHGGSSSRYDHLNETAFEYAFLLDQLGHSN